MASPLDVKASKALDNIPRTPFSYPIASFSTSMPCVSFARTEWLYSNLLAFQNNQNEVH